jgi:hypothetical protein
MTVFHFFITFLCCLVGINSKFLEMLHVMFNIYDVFIALNIFIFSYAERETMILHPILILSKFNYFNEEKTDLPLNCF